MKLYDGGRAPNPRRVRIFLAEKGIQIPLVPLELGKLDHKQPAFAALNPLQELPALELDDGSILTETIAICRYLEALYPEPNLFGVGARQQAEVEMWQRRIELKLFYAVAQIFRHSHPAMAALEIPQVPEWAQANRGHLIKILTFLNHHLENRSYICGEIFTVADITGLCALDFMKPAKFDLPDGLPHVQRWHERLAGRPSAAA